MIAGQIEIQLLANLARLQGDMNKAQSIVGSTASKMRSLLGTIGIGLGVGMFVRMIKGAIDAQDEMSKLSQKVGISVEGLAGLKYAADLSGVSFEGLQKGIKTISTQMFDANVGLLESQRNFAALKIDILDTNGALKAADKVLIEVADKFKDMPNGVEKTALAVKLFGKAGLDMIPLLNQGSAELAKWVAEGQKLNPITTESARQAELFNDSLTRLGGAVSAVGINILNDLLPMLSEVAHQFAEDALSEDIKTTASEVNGLTREVSGLATGLAFTGDSAMSFIAIMRLVGDSIGAMAATLGPLLKGDMDAVKAIEDAVEEKRKKILESTTTFRDALDRATKSAPAREAAVAATASLAAAAEAQAKANTAAEAALKASKAKVQALRDEVATQFMSAEAAELYALAQAKLPPALMAEAEALVRLKHENIQRIDSLQQIQEAEEEAAAAHKALVDEGVKIARAAQPFASHIALVEKLNAALRAGAVSQQEYNLAFDDSIQKTVDGLEKVTDKATVFADQAARNMQDAFADFLFDPFQDGLKGMLAGFIDTMRRMVAEAAAAQVFESMGGGSGILGSIISGMGGFFGSANGNAFNQSGVMAFANGGVVNSPTLFPFANGTGLMGEAGPEAIMPLKRGSNGKLGVESSGGAATVVVHQTFKIETGVAQTVRAELMNFMPMIKRETIGAVSDARRRGADV